MNETPHIPPILATPGLRLVDVGTTESGTPYFMFHARRGPIREVVVYMRTEHPTRFVYGYAIRDNTTRTETAYHGIYGDPELDELGELEGI